MLKNKITKKIDKKPIAITSYRKLISFFPLSLPQCNPSRVSKIPATLEATTYPIQE